MNMQVPNVIAPTPPRSLGDTGLSVVMMRDILLKTMFRMNLETVSEISRQIALPIPATQELIDLARSQKLLEATGTLRFKRGPFQLDIILASLPFESAALERAQRKRLFGRLVPLPTPEDLLLFKVLAGRDKDLHDAVGIARRHLARLDRRYLERSINQVCDLAEDLTAKRQLEAVLAKAASA